MANKIKLPIKVTRQRNLLHDHPLLSKGGVHQKSNKSKRRLEKVKMKKSGFPKKYSMQYFLENLFLLKFIRIISRIYSIPY